MTAKEDEEARKLFASLHFTSYQCSHCGTPIPITNIYVHRQTFFERLLGHYEIAGFWCPKCGEPFTRCERLQEGK